MRHSEVTTVELVLATAGSGDGFKEKDTGSRTVVGQNGGNIETSSGGIQ